MPDIAELQALLWNWGRWTRTGLGSNLGYPKGSPWARGWLPAQAWDSGWGDHVPGDKVLQPIDYRAAIATDGDLQQLQQRNRLHFTIIKRHYHSAWRQSEELLGEALRALSDLIAS